MESMTFARGPMIAITVLRVLVGWHFLYEGLSQADGARRSRRPATSNRPRDRWPGRSTRWRPGPTCSPTPT